MNKSGANTTPLPMKLTFPPWKIPEEYCEGHIFVLQIPVYAQRSDHLENVPPRHISE